MFILKEPRGRTGNVLLQNVGLSVLSEYYNLKPSGYVNLKYFDKIGLRVNQNGREFHSFEAFDDYSLPDLMLNVEKVEKGIFFDGGFQDKEFVLKFREEIKGSFELNYERCDNNDLFIHVRLGDVKEHNPGIDFYRKSIEATNFDNGFISSDSPSHPLVQKLMSEFNLVSFDNPDPLDTINFAKNLNNLIISKGTFSWWIATLSNAKNIIVPIGDPAWYGDIFVFEDWTYVPIK